MFSSTYFYLAVVIGIFALGDVFGFLTKGKLSGMMMVMLIFLIAFLSGIIPPDIINQAGLSAFSGHAVAMVLFNIGTGINVKQFIKEWKTVVLAACAMLASCLVMLLTAPLLGLDTVLVAMPVINGAAMATSLMTEAATAKGLNTVAALCAVIYAVQKFVGAPIASAMGMKYAKKLMIEYRKDPEKYKALLAKRQTGGVSKDKLFYEKHPEFFTSNMYIAIVAIGAWIARCLGSATPVNYSIWALALGCLSGIGGYIPPKLLQRGNAYGIMMIAVFGTIIPALAKVSIADLGTMALQTVVLFTAACAGIFIISYILPVWKLVGDKDLAMGIGVEQFLGFPSNVVICREVAQAIGETPDEQTYIEDTLSIPYVVGGITVVTVLSVTMAGIVISFLG